MVGSSPLTRGKLLISRDGETELGLIPAHAGKTPSTPRRSTGRPAHPRSRGENCDGLHQCDDLGGSSPLTRGKPSRATWQGAHTGLIPAHAGKTGRGRTAGREGGAHPRSRGENLEKLGGSFETLGSSPLTRGKRLGLTRAWMRRGLIPAHAGKTCETVLGSRCLGAHPRSRGENALIFARRRREYGSSPLTRAKR